MTFRRLYAFVALVISTTAVLISISGCGARLLVGNGFEGIYRYHQDTGVFLAVFVSPGSGGLETSTEPVLAYGPDGNLYVATYPSAALPQEQIGQVLRFNGANGTFIGVFVPPGSGGLIGPQGLAFGPDCNLYVAGGGRVLRYQGTTGDFVDAFVPKAPGGRLAFGPDGNLYMNDFSGQQIVRYDRITGAFLGVFVSEGTGGLTFPTALTFGPDGNLYVTGSTSTNTANSAVFRFNGSNGSFIDIFAPLVIAGAVALSTRDLVFGPDENLYVGLFRYSYDVPEVNLVARYDGTTGAFLGHSVDGIGLHAPGATLAFMPGPLTKQIDNLVVAVENLRLPPDIEKGFKNPLQNARAAIDAGALLAARNQLDAFTEKVRPNLGNLIPQPQANRIVIAANAIRDRLRCL